MNHSVSDFTFAYRKGYSTNLILIRRIENWRKALENNLIIGTVLMDLLKVFDSFPHDLLVVKLHVYGVGFDTVTFVCTYLKNRKQKVSVNNISIRCATRFNTRPNFVQYIP